jgi:hypothetical protein
MLCKLFSRAAIHSMPWSWWGRSGTAIEDEDRDGDGDGDGDEDEDGGIQLAAMAPSIL